MSANGSMSLSSTCDIIIVKEGSKVPRRGSVAKRDVLPDPLYNSKLVTRLINNIMVDGKRGVAQKIVYSAFDIIREKTGKDPLEVFEQALENMNSRLGSDDFELVATAVLTARQTGGELTGTLERVAALIRERVKIANKVRALTAVGRLQAIIIAAMPFFLLYMMTRVSPELMGEFLHSFAGVMAVILVVILDLLGFLWIRKITTIEV